MCSSPVIRRTRHHEARARPIGRADPGVADAACRGGGDAAPVDQVALHTYDVSAPSSTADTANGHLGLLAQVGRVMAMTEEGGPVRLSA
jgi:hypothetical protein